jgi:YD repeat-containing protein
VYNCKLCPPGQTPTKNGLGCTGDKISSPPNSGNNCNNTGRPINISTGNKYYSEVDYQDPDFTISRAYNSFAKEWSFSYRQKLYLSSKPGQATQAAADGSSYYPHEIWAFRQDGKLTKHSYNGSYTSSSPHTGERLQLLTQSFNATLLNNAGDIYLRGSNGLLMIENDQTVIPDLGNTHALLAGTRKELYDIKGRLTRIDQAGQKPIVLSYADNAITVRKEERSLSISTDAKGRVVTIKLPDDSELAYGYGLSNGSEVLLSVERSYGDGSQATLRRYLHEDTRFPTHITGVEDANGNRISSVQYDAEGRAISSEVGPLGSGVERTKVQYNKDGSRTITNALGKQSVQRFTQINGENRVTQVSGIASANCAAANRAYAYDTNGLLLSKTDWQGNTTTYSYNDQGQETSRTEASGTAQARTISTEWHPTLFLPTLVTEPDRITRYQYDDQGRQLSRTVEAR